MSELIVACVSMWFESKETTRNGIFSVLPFPPLAPSFTRFIFHAVILSSRTTETFAMQAKAIATRHQLY